MSSSDITPERGVSTFVGCPDMGVPQQFKDNTEYFKDTWNDRTTAYVSLLATDYVNDDLIKSAMDWADSVYNSNTQCYDKESCDFDFDGYALVVVFEDEAGTRQVDSDDEIIMCMEQSMYDNDYSYTCTDQNNEVYILDQNFDFTTEGQNLDFGDKKEPTNFGWLNDSTRDTYATGFGDFLFRGNTKLSKKEATWTYFMPTTNAVRDSVKYTIDTDTIGNRWDTEDKVNVFICDLDNEDPDTCMGGEIEICCGALSGLQVASTLIAAAVVALSF